MQEDHQRSSVQQSERPQQRSKRQGTSTTRPEDGKADAKEEAKANGEANKSLGTTAAEENQKISGLAGKATKSSEVPRSREM